jgi:hypothetical protein
LRYCSCTTWIIKIFCYPSLFFDDVWLCDIDIDRVLSSWILFLSKFYGGCEWLSDEFYFLALTRLDSKSTCLSGSLWSWVRIGTWVLHSCCCYWLTWDFGCHLSTCYCCDQMVLWLMYYFSGFDLAATTSITLGNQD